MQTTAQPRVLTDGLIRGVKHGRIIHMMPHIGAAGAKRVAVHFGDPRLAPGPVGICRQAQCTGNETVRGWRCRHPHCYAVRLAAAHTEAPKRIEQSSHGGCSHSSPVSFQAEGSSRTTCWGVRAGSARLWACVVAATRHAPGRSSVGRRQTSVEERPRPCCTAPI